MHTTSLAEPKTADARDARLLIAAPAENRHGAPFGRAGRGAQARRRLPVRPLGTGRRGAASSPPCATCGAPARSSRQHFTHILLAGFPAPAAGRHAADIGDRRTQPAVRRRAGRTTGHRSRWSTAWSASMPPPLELLEQRLAVLPNARSWPPDENPVGPGMRWPQAMHDALHAVELSTVSAHRAVQVHRARAGTALTALYDRINARLGEAGDPAAPAADRRRSSRTRSRRRRPRQAAIRWRRPRVRRPKCRPATTRCFPA